MNIFEGLRVLECGPRISGHYCGKLLADLGAEVVKIEEPRTGDWTRHRGPFLNDERHPEKSGLFLYLNTNKLGITLNPKTPSGREIFLALTRSADVVIESYPPGMMEGWGLSFARLETVNPRLVMVSLSPFGQSGPYRDFKAYPLNVFHAGGEGSLLPGGLGWELYEDREPIAAPGYVGDIDGGIGAAAALAAALVWRGMSGEGQYIDCSEQELLLNISRVELARYANEGLLETRASRSFPYAGLMQCKDGFAQVMPLEDHMWHALVRLMGNPEWALKPEYRERNSRNLHGEEINEKLSEWLLTKDSEWLFHEGQKEGCPVGVACTTEDLLKSDQLRAREFFVEIEHPVCGKLTYPTTPYRFSSSPAGDWRPAPLLGQHNHEVYGQRLGYTPEELGRLSDAGVL